MTSPVAIASTASPPADSPIPTTIRPVHSTPGQSDSHDFAHTISPTQSAPPRTKPRLTSTATFPSPASRPIKPRSETAPGPAVESSRRAQQGNETARPRRPPTLNKPRSQRQTWSPALARTGGADRATRPVLNLEALSYVNIREDPKSKNHDSHARVLQDGRVHISLNALKDGPLSTLLHRHSHSYRGPADSSENYAPQPKDIYQGLERGPPKLNIVIQLIGSRGDIQPFIAIAKVLKEQWGHRVRLATHGAFREFVEGNGIEFFDIGGDPAELMAFMVKNPGLIPSVETIKRGDIVRRREQMFEMFQGLWRSCIEPRDTTPHQNMPMNENSAEQSNNSSDSGLRTLVEKDVEPFIADAIIANPPSFAHVHCAEKLGIPLQLVFTFPYSPTSALPHPLAFVQTTNLASDVTNIMSYNFVDLLVWQGLGDLVNRFRQQILHLPKLSTLWAPGMIDRLRVPYTYMWSPALIPKPPDWGEHIDVTGFVFLDQTQNFTPSDELAKFLDSGPPPVYIGFGSIVVDDPDGLTAMLFEAVKTTGVRALISKGWGGLGGEGSNIPDNIFMLGNTPHDWLFPKVSAVVHHGGAGTTAIGLLHGKPTMIVPFFGDQQFWGSMVANADAGPEPVPHKELTTEKLVAGIEKLLSKECQEAAQEISRKIQEEDGNGAENAVRSFFKGLNNLNKGRRGLKESGRTFGEAGPMGPAEGKRGGAGPGIRCDVLDDQVAVWRVRRTTVKMSAVAASYLVKSRRLDWSDFRLHRATDWSDYDGPGEPLTGGFSAAFHSVAGVIKGVAGVPYTWYKGAKRIDEEGLDLPVELNLSKARRSRSRSRARKSTDAASSANRGSADTNDADDEEQNTPPPSGRRPHRHMTISEEVGQGTKRSLTNAAKAGLKAPMDITLAIAQGFHNAPRLYGDEVRRPPRITGFQSGLRAAGKEFALGMYDAASGIVLQPYTGAKQQGAVGFMKGVGKGVGGMLFKTGAATTGVFAYSMKGVHREMKKGRDRRLTERIRQARIRQGEIDLERWIQEGRERELKAKCQDGWKLVQDSRRAKQERKQRILRELDVQAKLVARKDRKRDKRGAKQDAKEEAMAKPPTVEAAT